MARKKTWIEKRDGAPAPHVTVLEKPFAGLAAGAKLLISSPLEIAELIAAVPKGQITDAAEIRATLASRHKAAGTCPLTTGIFLRIVAEAALEEAAGGKKKVTPFWRAIDPTTALAKKLSCGPEHIAALRAAETQ
jgi:hypothetical protein